MMVSDKTVDEVLKRVDILAEKVGTSVEFLYPLYVNQQYIDAAVFTITLIIAVAILIYSTTYLIKSRNGKRYKDFSGKESVAMGIMIVSAIGTVMSLTAFLVEAPHIFNPEMWAFKELLMDIK